MRAALAAAVAAPEGGRARAAPRAPPPPDVPRPPASPKFNPRERRGAA